MGIMKKYKPLILALRPNQWVKNLILFTAIIFTGKLFDSNLFFATFAGFIIFSALSSASYLFNDIMDLSYDKLHPEKKKRPLAAGLIPVNSAIETAFILAFFGLIAALFVNVIFFFIAVLFVLLHIVYTLFLKKRAVLDILGISFSFMLRAFAGEAITGYHLPYWMTLTILFLSLFIAAAKRHAELIREGDKTRPALHQYREHLLDAYTSVFATATVITYSLFTYFEEPIKFNEPIRSLLTNLAPKAIDRKWMMIGIPFVLYGLMRYAQLLYERNEGEAPEKIVTTDKPLIVSMALWGISTILVLYVL